MRRLMLCEKYFLPKPNKPKKGHGEVLLQSTVAERCHDSERPLPVMLPCKQKGETAFLPAGEGGSFLSPCQVKA